MAARYWVRRVQIRDTSVAHTFEGRQSNVGRTQESKLYSTREAAEREAKAWRDTGDWTAEVLATVDDRC